MRAHATSAFGGRNKVMNSCLMMRHPRAGETDGVTCSPCFSDDTMDDGKFPNQLNGVDKNSHICKDTPSKVAGVYNICCYRIPHPI